MKEQKKAPTRLYTKMPWSIVRRGCQCLEEGSRRKVG
jgi:hypothetical protein